MLSDRPAAPAGAPKLEAAAAAAFLLALAAALFAFVRPTNFGGTDEWLSLSLLSRGIGSFPYASRPLNLVWALPGWSLFRQPPWQVWDGCRGRSPWLSAHCSSGLPVVLRRTVFTGSTRSESFEMMTATW
jgi:hypothetical protein